MRLLLPAALVVAIDQISKRLVWHNGHNYEFIPGFFNLTLVKNAGAAFGMFQGGRVVFVAASALAVVLIAYVAVRLPRADTARRVWLGLILGGAVGNLIDRVASGQVVDFIQIGFQGHYWPVFNVADMGVTIGAVLLIVLSLRQHRTRTSAAGSAVPETTSPTPDDSSLHP